MSARAALLAVLLLAGCASSPAPHFYTLSAPPSSGARAAGPSVSIGPVTIPALVDRPQIVVTVGDNEVWLDEFNRWAAPLADGIGIAIAQNVAVALGSPRVTLLAPASASAEYTVAVEVQRFDSALGDYALLDAVYTVRRTADGRTVAGRTTDRQVPADASYAALAAAHSRAIARLATDIGATVKGIAAQPRPSAPSPAR